jgi:hypothetical protein
MSAHISEVPRDMGTGRGQSADTQYERTGLCYCIYPVALIQWFGDAECGRCHRLRRDRIKGAK